MIQTNVQAFFVFFFFDGQEEFKLETRREKFFSLSVAKKKRNFLFGGFFLFGSQWLLHQLRFFFACNVCVCRCAA